MSRYKGKAAKWQQQDKEEQKMNKTEFIKVRCTLEEKQRIKSKAESAGRKFSDYCREILLNGEVTAVPKMTDNEREAIAILQHTGRFYGQVFQSHQGQGRRLATYHKEPFLMCQRSI